MKKKELLFIKIGGGVITDKTKHYKMREGVLDRLVEEIKEGFSGVDDLDLIIGNGAGSFAHFSAKKYGTKNGFSDKDGAIGAGWVRWDAVKLNQIVVEALLRQRIPAFSFSPSSIFAVELEKVRDLCVESMLDALRVGLVPVVYGDVMIDRRQGSTIFSTERVFEVLLMSPLVDEYEKVRVVHVGAERGVIKGEKGKDNQKLIKIISDTNWKRVKKYLSGSDGVDVTGGMLHKVEMSLRLADRGVESWIISGLIENRLRDVILNKEVEGTKIISSRNI